MYVEKTKGFGRMEWHPDGHLECSDYPVCKCCGNANANGEQDTQPVWLCQICREQIIQMTLEKIISGKEKV